MRASADEKKALDDRLPAIYNQLRRIAHSMLRGRTNPTLTATAVVHEAYARLAVSGKIPNVTEMSFKRIVAHVMREVLCDAARRRLAGKRGGKDAIRVPIAEDLQDNRISIERILLVNDFLDRLQTVDPRSASVVELLFFGGLTMSEVAAELEVSVSTVEREWRAARAWLSSVASRPAGV